MKFFLDTANLDEIRHIARLGILAGVTTNPSLLAREHGADFKATIQQIDAIVGGHVSAEVTETDAAGMIRQGRDIATWSEHVVVKIPMTEDGLEAVSTLTADGISVNTTLIFSANQALLAARAGADFVSPFVGRLDDISEDGMALVSDCVDIFRQHPGVHTEVLAASLRHPLHVTQAARCGADIGTMPYTVLLQCMRHPLTDAGLARFMADWQASQAAIAAAR